jgi:hypothetical protein
MKRVANFLSLSGLIGFLLLAVPVVSQQAWNKKPYLEWTLSDTRKILMDSPWAQMRIEKIHNDEYFSIIRLHSALPIRQALVREKQIQLNYSKFSAVDTARFDSEVRVFLQCPDCQKYYMVSLSSKALRPLRQLTLEQVKPYIYLANERGERRALISFIGPGADTTKVIFVFQRFDDQGKSLIEVNNKKLYFQVEEKLLENKTVPIGRFSFEVSRLIQNGVVVF